jgi:hypothetical protein
MHEVPAEPVVLGVMLSHAADVLAVQVPEPAVRIEPPPPSLVKERVGGSIVTCPHADWISKRAKSQISWNGFLRVRIAVGEYLILIR